MKHDSVNHLSECMSFDSDSLDFVNIEFEEDALLLLQFAKDDLHLTTEQIHTETNIHLDLLTDLFDLKAYPWDLTIGQFTSLIQVLNINFDQIIPALNRTEIILPTDVINDETKFAVWYGEKEFLEFMTSQNSLLNTLRQKKQGFISEIMSLQFIE